MVVLKSNPTINYAELVLQPQTLSYGLYRLNYRVTMLYNVSLTSQIDTFIKIIPSGLVLSTLKLSQPMYGGTIEITRGTNQSIQFDPFLFTYDIDSIADITSLTFKYSCQKIDSGLESGYPKISGTNKIINLDEIKLNSSLKIYDKCFNTTGI